MTILRFAVVVEVLSDKPPRRPGLIVGAVRLLRDCLIGWLF